MDGPPTPPTDAQDAAPPGVPPEDAALACFVRSGDADAFAALYDELAPSLLRLAARLLPDHAAAEDALQATFLAALSAAARWDGRPVRPWMTGILANVVRNQRRSAARVPDAARLPTRAAPSDPFDDAAHAELDRALDATVRALPDAWQQPVLLRVREGLSAEQIARVLGRPAGTIRSQLARGLARLRRGLAGAFALLGGARPHRTTPRAAEGRLATSAPGAGALTLGGVLVLKLTGVVLGVGTLGAAAWFAWPATDDAAPALEAPRAASTAMALDPPASGDVEALAPSAVVAADVASPDDDPARVAPAAAPVAPDDEVVGPLAVLVLDAERRPVPAALVEVFGDETPREGEGFWRSPPRVTSGALPRSSRATDAEGRCSVTLGAREVLAARHDVLGRSLLRSAELLRWYASNGQEVVLELAQPCRLAGRVLDARGAPLPGALVDVSNHTGGGEGDERAVDDLVAASDGSFETLVDVPAGWRVQARVDERRSSTFQVEARAGASHDFELVVPDTWRVEGVLVDASGAPHAGGQVVLWEDGSRLLDGPTPAREPFDRRVTTGDDGAFRIDVPHLGTWHVVGLPDADFGSGCAAPQRAPRASDALDFEPSDAASDVFDVELTSDAPSRSFTLALRRAAPVRGTVVDDEGHPLAGHVVRARPSGMSRRAAMFDTGPDAASLLGQGRAATGADGAFLIDGLHPDGRFDLEVHPDERSGFVVARVGDVPAGRDDVLLVVPEAARQDAFVEGRVVDARSGEPVAHFRVELTWEAEPELWTTREWTFDDEDGRFRIGELVPGRAYRPKVTATTGRNVPDMPFDMHEDRVDVVPAVLDDFVGSVDGLTLAVGLPGPSRLEVELLDASGAPLAHRKVGLRFDPIVAMRSWGSTTDDRGVAVFESLGPARYRVTASIGDETVGELVVVPPGGDVRVTLRP